jgi:hypothetical protein
VIGPKGVFIVDAKSWRGIISADSHGGMLLNGEPPAFKDAKPLINRILHFKKQLQLSELNAVPWFQAVFAFTSARVEAKWGSTGAVDCVRHEKLLDYILGGKRSKLRPREVEIISEAFSAFEPNPAGSSPVAASAIPGLMLLN